MIPEFNEWNIDEYYIKEVLKESTDEEKETAEMLAAYIMKRQES